MPPSLPPFLGGKPLYLLFSLVTIQVQVVVLLHHWQSIEPPLEADPSNLEPKLVELKWNKLAVGEDIIWRGYHQIWGKS